MKNFKKCLLGFILLSTFGIFNFANAETSSAFLSIPTEKNTQQKQTITLIKTYYEALNKKDMRSLFSIIESNVIHDINQGNTEQGIEKFKTFMKQADASFDEKLDNIILTVSDDGKYAAAQWVDHGTYSKDYPGMDRSAKNQKFNVPGGHFFEIRNGKIYRVTTYYNAADFNNQIAKQ